MKDREFVIMTGYEGMMKFKHAMQVAQFVNDAGSIFPYIKDKKPLSNLASLSIIDMALLQRVLVDVEYFVNSLE